jgi:hypothetical protein
LIPGEELIVADEQVVSEDQLKRENEQYEVIDIDQLDPDQQNYLDQVNYFIEVRILYLNYKHSFLVYARWCNLCIG